MFGRIRVANRATITVETDSIRFFCDGSNPSAGVGHILVNGDMLILEHPDDIKNFRAIRVTTDATIQVSYQ